MKLRTYIDGERGIASRLAGAIKTPVQSVYSWAAESRPVPMEHCVPIEQWTEGAVTCEELRPDLKAHFQYLRSTGPKPAGRAGRRTE